MQRAEHGRIVILGAGGHGRVAADVAAAVGYDPVAFLDPAWPDLATSGIWPVLGTDDDPTLRGVAAQGAAFFIAIGEARTRAALFARVKGLGGRIVSLVHPTATLSPRATLGQGVLVAAGAIVNPFARIGDGSIVNTGAIVEHDCTLAAFAHVAPAAALAGGVTLAGGATVGLGARVIQGITIGARATVGAGAVVLRDVPDGQTVVGVPARALPGRS